MALNSINTNVAAYYAQSNIGKASTMASSSISRLSSGDRIVRAADDVAAMSAGTSLRTNVTTLRMALVNTSQGSSLLQVADGALSQVTDILQRQKAIAVQAGSGSLTENERSFLNQEFQSLTSEIDRLADQTNFNGVTLLDGGLTEKVNVADVEATATASKASINFAVQNTGVQTLVLNGETLTGGTEFAVGATIQDTVDNLVTYLNSLDGSSTRDIALSQATYSREGSSLVITSDQGGVQGQDFRIDGTGTWTAAAGAATINGGTATATINLFDDNDIAAASTSVSVTNAAVSASEQIDVGTIIVTHNGSAQTIYTAQATDSLDDIVAGINSNTSTTGITASIIGRAGAYNIQLEHEAVSLNGTASNMVITGDAITGADASVTESVGATDTVNNVIFSLDGGDDFGIGAGDTLATGNVGNDILKDNNQTRSVVELIFPDINDADLIDDLTITGVPVDITFETGAGTTINPHLVFSFTEGGTGATEITIGATLAETLDNAVETINSYVGNGAENYALDQITARREGNNIVFESNDVGDATVVDGTVLTISQTTAASGNSLTNGGDLNNGETDGITTSGITNSAFTGQLSGFNASYTGTANEVNLSITIGDHTYEALDVSTNPTADTTVRLSSQTGGGYFDIQMAANKGAAVSSQVGADNMTTRLNAAFESVTFFQNREVSSYTADSPILTDSTVTGSLIGTSVSLNGSDFSDVSIDSIRVSAPEGSNPDGSITMTINGEEYTSGVGLGSKLGANSSFILTSASDSNKYMTFNTGDVAIQLETQAKADSFETALQGAFGVGNGDANLQFQVGSTVDDTLSIGIGNIKTSELFNGAELNVLTAENAAAASAALDTAIDSVTKVRADVGALQSRFDFAAANVESSLQNQDAARGILLDTDISAESTAFATAQVQLQAGISVLAQANQLPQNLLKLIG